MKVILKMRNGFLILDGMALEIGNEEIHITLSGKKLIISQKGEFVGITGWDESWRPICIASNILIDVFTVTALGKEISLSA